MIFKLWRWWQTPNKAIAHKLTRNHHNQIHFWYFFIDIIIYIFLTCCIYNHAHCNPEIWQCNAKKKILCQLSLPKFLQCNPPIKVYSTLYSTQAKAYNSCFSISLKLKKMSWKLIMMHKPKFVVIVPWSTIVLTTNVSSLEYEQVSHNGLINPQPYFNVMEACNFQ